MLWTRPRTVIPQTRLQHKTNKNNKTYAMDKATHKAKDMAADKAADKAVDKAAA